MVAVQAKNIQIWVTKDLIVAQQVVAIVFRRLTINNGKLKVWLRFEANFRDRTDKANFSYSLDGKEWKSIGDTLQMHYDWPDFCGYRFALFHYATQQPGGIADFDYFHVNNK